MGQIIVCVAPPELCCSEKSSLRTHRELLDLGGTQPPVWLMALAVMPDGLCSRAVYSLMRSCVLRAERSHAGPVDTCLLDYSSRETNLQQSTLKHGH